MDEVANGITMKMIYHLDHSGSDSRYFLESIYEKMENFDLLLWQAMPEGELKHQFWESSLVLARAQDIIKKQVSGEL